MLRQRLGQCEKEKQREATHRQGAEAHAQEIKTLWVRDKGIWSAEKTALKEELDGELRIGRGRMQHATHQHATQHGRPQPPQNPAPGTPPDAMRARNSNMAHKPPDNPRKTHAQLTLHANSLLCSAALQARRPQREWRLAERRAGQACAGA